MVNAMTPARWVAKIVADIQTSTFAQVVLVIRNAAPPVQTKKPLRQRLKVYWTHSLFERYRAWDRKRNRVALDAFEETDLSAILHDVMVLPAKPIQKGFVDRFGPEDIAQIRQANLDVLFRFGFRIIKGDILSCAKYGIWSFHHGDNREYRGAPPGFWEMYERNPVAGSILQVLTESLDGGRLIYRSLAATNFDSLYLTLNPIYWKTAEFALRRLRDLHCYGWDYLQSLDEFNEADTYKKGIYRTPAAPVMARFLARLALRKLFFRIRSLFFVERTVWFNASRPRVGARTALTDTNSFEAILPPRSRFYADPFPIKSQGKNYLFFENFDFARGRAAIDYMELEQDGRWSAPHPALATDCHLSYPFLFERDGQVYMIPETRERKTIELYRAVNFPQQWELVKVLARDVLAVDSTIFQHGGKLWLFVNMAVAGGSTFDELHLFHADSLKGQWTPHPKNPIVSDVRRSRPAGALFFDDGHPGGQRLIRPSQDCSLRYGSAITLNEVQVLSETDYRETPCGRIEPAWYPGSVCTHTYNRTDDIELLDGMLIEYRLRFLAS